jgi:hypothetical protein
MKNQSSSMVQKPSSLQFRKLSVWKAMLSVMLLLALSFIGGQGHAQAAADAHLSALNYNPNLVCNSGYYYSYDINDSIRLERSTGETVVLIPITNNNNITVSAWYGDGTHQEPPYLPYIGSVGSDGPEMEVYYNSNSPSLETVDACSNWYPY